MLHNYIKFAHCFHQKMQIRSQLRRLKQGSCELNKQLIGSLQLSNTALPLNYML